MFITFRSLFSVRKYFKRLPKQSKHPKAHTRGTRLSARFVGMYTIRFYMKKILFKWYLPFPPVTFIYLFFQINITESVLTTKAATERCSPEKQLLLDLQKLKEWYFRNIGKITWKKTREGAQHLAVAASVTTK